MISGEPLPVAKHASSRVIAGIARGPGTDLAMQSAGVTLVQEELDGIVRARR